MTQLDITPIINLLVPIGFAVLSAFGSVAVKKIADYFHLKADDTSRQYLETAMTNAIAFARAEANKSAGHGMAVSVSMNNVERTAAQYALNAVPGAVKRLGLTPEHVQKMVAARLAKG